LYVARNGRADFQPENTPLDLSRSLVVMGRRAAFGAVVLLLLLSRAAAAQTSDLDLGQLASRLASWAAVTGYEQGIVDSILALLPQAQRDRAGNAILRLGGDGPARRLVACPLDETGYVIGGMRPDGYLTLRRTGRAVSPLFDQQLEGQRVSIQGARGVVPGVVAVRSIHLSRGRDSASAPFTVDDALVDVGAASAAQVKALGVQVLSPVTLVKRPHRYGKTLLAATDAGRRTACAALIVAARASRFRAKLLPPVTVAFIVEDRLEARGLATLSNADGPFQETVIVDGTGGQLGALDLRIDAETAARWPGLGPVKRWSLPVKYAGTAVETVSLVDADSLRQKLMDWIGGDR
jgi:M42 glutamyl aminopeptidase